MNLEITVIPEGMVLCIKNTEKCFSKELLNYNLGQIDGIFSNTIISKQPPST